MYLNVITASYLESLIAKMTKFFTLIKLNIEFQIFSVIQNSVVAITSKKKTNN